MRSTSEHAVSSRVRLLPLAVGSLVAAVTTAYFFLFPTDIIVHGGSRPAFAYVATLLAPALAIAVLLFVLIAALAARFLPPRATLGHVDVLGVAVVGFVSGLWALPSLSAGLPQRLFAAVATAALSMLAAWLTARVTRALRGRVELLAGLSVIALVSLAFLYQNSYVPSRYDHLRIEPEVQAGGLPPNIVVLGLDGADWKLLNRFVDDGLLPNFERLMESGVAAPLRPFQPTSSPFLWNSIYTGFTPARHEQRPVVYPVGRETLIRYWGGPWHPVRDWITRLKGTELRYPLAFWDVLRAAGYSATVIGSWEYTVTGRGTWETRPTPQFGPYFLTVEAEYLHFGDPEARLMESDRAYAAWFAPEQAELIRELDVPPSEIPTSEWLALLESQTAVDRLLDLERIDFVDTPVPAQRLGGLRAIYPSDRLRMKLGLRAIRDSAKPYMVFLYNRGIDVAQHCYAHLLRGEDSPEEEDLRAVVQSYYKLQDRWLGDVLEVIDENTVLLVVSDHGIDLDEYLPGNNPHMTGFHHFAPDGIFLASGPGIEPARPNSVYILDVAPTVLSLARVPILAAMEGRVVDEVAERTRAISDWLAMKATIFAAGDPELTNPELEEQLKNLGYF